MTEAAATRKPIVILPEQGRVYTMGRMRAIFKADAEESAGQYAVSEWWLEPRTHGPGLHSHSEDHVFYVIEGTLSVCLNDHWSHLNKGAYVLIPGGTPHDFQNQHSVPAGFLAFNAPGGFEARMPEIAEALSSEDLRL